MLPVVFVFDLDRTLIGDPMRLLAYRDLLDFIKNACGHMKGKLVNPDTGETICEGQLPCWRDVVLPEYFRPGLKDAFAQIKALYPTAEFFIFSAGTNGYVKDMVELVEKHMGVMFNRPLLGRSECSMTERGNYVKNIRVNIGAIIGALRKRYKGVVKHTEEILEDRLIFIDDIAGFLDKDDRWVRCPVYDYMSVFQVDDRLMRLTYNIPSVQTYLNSYRQNQRDQILPSGPHNMWLAKLARLGKKTADHMTYDQYKEKYFRFLAKYCRLFGRTNAAFLRDEFMAKFVKAIRPYSKHARPFSKEHIATVNKACNK